MLALWRFPRLMLSTHGLERQSWALLSSPRLGTRGQIPQLSLVRRIHGTWYPGTRCMHTERYLCETDPTRKDNAQDNAQDNRRTTTGVRQELSPLECALACLPPVFSGLMARACYPEEPALGLSLPQHERAASELHSRRIILARLPNSRCSPAALSWRATRST